MHKVRNIKPGFKRGLWFGLANGAFETLTGGAAPWTLKNSSNQALGRLDQYESPDREWKPRALPPRDRLASVYFAQTRHDETQPVHLRVADTHLCATRCTANLAIPAHDSVRKRV